MKAHMVMFSISDRDKLVEYLKQAPMIYVEDAVNFLRSLKAVEVESMQQPEPEDEEESPQKSDAPINPYVRKQRTESAPDQDDQ